MAKSKKYPSQRRSTKRLAKVARAVKLSKIAMIQSNSEEQTASSSMLDETADHIANLKELESLEGNSPNVFKSAEGLQTLRTESDASPERSASDIISMGFPDVSPGPLYVEYVSPAKAIPKITKPTPVGRRFMSVTSVAHAMNVAARHGGVCTNARFEIVSEKRVGLFTELLVKCTGCNRDPFTISSDLGNQTLPVNEAAVWAAHTGGAGFNAMESSLAVMDIPFMCRQKFMKIETGSYDRTVSDCLAKQLKLNGEEEFKLAKLAGDVIEVDGRELAYTDVCADGQWGKRCYNQTGNANSGSAVLVGLRSKKVLHISVRNKFCLFCKIHASKDEIPEHKCYKNWNGTSSAMEADIILEGFQKSMDHHNLIFKRLIADGDSSVYNSVRLNYLKPELQRLVVEKIECKNHAIRRMNKNLRLLLLQTKIPVTHRKMLKERLNRIGKYVVYAIEHNKCFGPGRNADSLHSDLLNTLFHAFGQHDKCASYLCESGKLIVPEAYRKPCKDKTAASTKSFSANLVSTLSSTYLWLKMQEIVERISNLSVSLIHGITSNVAENIQGQINKFLGGKRTNWSLRGGYNRKVAASVIAAEHGSGFSAEMYRIAKCKSPGPSWKRMLTLGQRKREAARRRPKRIRNKKYVILNRPTVEFFSKSREFFHGGDADYGANANAPDMSEDELKQRMEDYIKNLTVTAAERELFSQETKNQFQSETFRQRRKFMLTASRAQEFANMKDYTSNVSKIDSFFQPIDISKKPAVSWGIEKEHIAAEQYKKTKCANAERCGLFVSTEFGALGASPDLQVGNDGIVEIKCPFLERFGKPQDVVNRKNDAFLERKTGKIQKGESRIRLKRSHKYYDQIVMQLHVTERQWCDFVVWTQGPENGVGYMFIERICKDKNTSERWEAIKPKLIRFFKEDLLPEIINPRFNRTMGYRQPSYRLSAIRAKKSKQEQRVVIDAAKKKVKKYVLSSSIKATFETVITNALLNVTPKMTGTGRNARGQRLFNNEIAISPFSKLASTPSTQKSDIARRGVKRKLNFE